MDLRQLSSPKLKKFAIDKSFAKTQTNHSATCRHVLAFVITTRHYQHHLLRQDITNLTNLSMELIAAKILTEMTEWLLEELSLSTKHSIFIEHADDLSSSPPHSIHAFQSDAPPSCLTVGLHSHQLETIFTQKLFSMLPIPRKVLRWPPQPLSIKSLVFGHRFFSSIDLM